MTIFDFLVLFVLACSIVISTMRGLVKEMLSLLGWVAAFFVAGAYGAPFAQMLPQAISGGTLRLIVAYVALFAGVWLLMMLFGAAVGALVTAAGLTVADRGLGGLFGLARGLVIVLAVVLLCGTTAVPQQPFWRNALFSPLAETAARTVLPFLPGSFSKHVRF